MASLFITPARATSATGSVYPDAAWYFYQTGTLTLTTVYADSNLTTPLANPVTAVDGTFPDIYFSGNVVIRAVLKSSITGSIIYDIDPYLTGGSGSGGGSGYLTVEDFGAVGDNATDDRAAIQAAIDYAITNGIPEVRFLHKAYVAKCSTRVAGGFGDINPTGGMIDINGSLASAPFGIKLTGLLGGTTITMIGYNTGGSTDTDYQTFSASPWRGHGIQLYGTQNNDPDVSDMDLWVIQCFEMENITIDGGRTAGGKTATSTDTSNKGICTFNAVRKIVLRNGGVLNFGHELLYGGGGGYGSGTLYPMEVRLENFKALHSNHSCLNFQDTNLIDINGEYGDAYIAAEQYGNDSRFIGTVFRDANQLNFSAADRSLIPGGQPYNFPSQGTSLRKTQLVGVTTRGVDTLLIGPYTYGSITSIDGRLDHDQYSFSIDLDATYVLDQLNNATPLTIAGPGAVPSGVATGMLPRDITYRLSVKATLYAVGLGHNIGAVVGYSGYLDPDSVKIHVDCSVTADNGSVSGGPAHGAPHIIWNSWNTLQSNAQLVPGFSIGGVTSGSLDPTTGGITAYPAGTSGGENMTFGTIGSGGSYEGFAHGQRYHFFHGNSAGRFNFAQFGTGMSLSRNRVCFQAGDNIIFEYNKRLDKWTDVGGFTSDYLHGSATYDWPSIAAGATATTTITVTGAVLGDLVDSISHGVSLAGLNCTGYVSAADTVTLVMTNPTAGAIDLASTTVRVVVQRV